LRFSSVSILPFFSNGKRFDTYSDLATRRTGRRSRPVLPFGRSIPFFLFRNGEASKNHSLPCVHARHLCFSLISLIVVVLRSLLCTLPPGVDVWFSLSRTGKRHRNRSPLNLPPPASPGLSSGAPSFSFESHGGIPCLALPGHGFSDSRGGCDRRLKRHRPSAKPVFHRRDCGACSS